MASGTFEVFRDKAGQWRFRLKAKNGRILCQSEGYTRKENCLNGITAVGWAVKTPKVTEV